ncbi:MAG TPA: hypothetical protein VMA55_20190 [Acidovorax sp.]|nr:hypothetical protein [Acidovorax sp.]
MAELTGQVGELRMTVQITSKETGKVEEYELTGSATKEQAEALGAEMGDEPKED